MISSLRHAGVAGDSGTSPPGGICDTARLGAGGRFGSEIAPHQLWHGASSFVTVGWILYAISPFLRNPC
jgi:hypothetical protein